MLGPGWSAGGWDVSTTVVLDVDECGACLSEEVAALEPGDRIILCRGNRPVAEIVPLKEASMHPRPIGLGKGLAQVPGSFFDPLPDDVLARFS